ncbi:MAG: hypothetical protein WBB28_19540 [Crinalium sp.]
MKRNQVQLEIEGKIYEGSYRVTNGMIDVWYLNNQKTTQLGGLNEEALAKLLLSEMVIQAMSQPQTSSKMINVRIFERSSEEKKWKGLFLKEFFIVPRIGDYIGLEKTSYKVLYKVIAVVHPEKSEAVEIFVEQIINQTPENIEPVLNITYNE